MINYRFIRKKKLGYTIVELLVVMIISGIVILLVFEGISTLNKYNDKISYQIKETIILSRNIQILKNITQNTDSLNVDNGNILLLKKGECPYLLTRKNKYLLLVFKDKIDTLFDKILDLNVTREENELYTVDLLSILLKKNKRDTLFLSFYVGVQKNGLLK